MARGEHSIDMSRAATSGVTQAADRLIDAARGAPCQPIRELLPTDDLDAAYAVQDINTERAVAAGRRIVGRKIGLTSLAVQQQLGVAQPDFGILFADMAMGEGMAIPASRLMQPKIEAEVALIMS